MAKAIAEVPVSTAGRWGSLTHASASEEPLAKGERKESLHCYCQSEKKTKFGGACSMKLVLTLAGATRQCSETCKLFPFLGKWSVLCVFDDPWSLSKPSEKFDFHGCCKPQKTGDCSLPTALTWFDSKSPLSLEFLSVPDSQHLFKGFWRFHLLPLFPYICFWGPLALPSQVWKLPLLTLCP